MLKTLGWLSCLFVAVLANTQVQAADVPLIDAEVMLERSLPGATVAVGHWRAPAGTDFVYVAAGDSGVEWFTTRGSRQGRQATIFGDIALLQRADRAAPLALGLLAGVVGERVELMRLGVDGTPRVIGAVMPGVAPRAVCLYESPLTGRPYLFVLGEDGWAELWSLVWHARQMQARPVRRIAVGGETKGCATAGAHRSMLVTEAAVGVWMLPAEPEGDSERRALVMTRPWGDIKSVAALAVVAGENDAGYAVVADKSDGRLHIHDLKDGRHRGSLRASGVASPETLAFVPHDETLLLAVAGKERHVALLSWREIERMLALPALRFADPRLAPERPLAVVEPSAQTRPVPSRGDAADDAAIWVDAGAPERSLVIGTNKRLGLHVYDLAGNEIQTLPDGRMNNVDLRYGFALDGRRVDIVAASNRSDDSLALYRVDPQARRLVAVHARVIPTGFDESYGLCMYHDRMRDEHFVFVNNKDGLVHQFRLEDAGNERVDAQLVRRFAVGSQTEGCVADDRRHHLYIGEEKVGIWRYGARPVDRDARVAIDGMRKTGGQLVADVEGLSLHDDGKRTLLVASSQGDDSYVVYDVTGEARPVGRFMIAANEALGIDGASETDGLAVASTPLGADYPRGLLVVQDGRKVAPPANQNFKLVSWRAVERALGLDR